MDRLVGRRARGVQRAREACACAFPLRLHYSPPPEAVVVVGGKMSTFSVFCWGAMVHHCRRFLRIRPLRW